MSLVQHLLLLTILTSNAFGEMALSNVTRFATGDLFTLDGTDCGPTRCMEVSHGTALNALDQDDDICMCQCRKETPAFREDQQVCVDVIEECSMASFGKGSTNPQIPFVFLPLKGQIIYPSKEIIFTSVDNAICAVTNAQYLSSNGWVTLRDLVDNDVPFGLYRDEGSTFLQWRGSPALHARLEGRLVAAHVLCSAPTPSRLAASCAAFRIAGASHSSMLDVRSIPFHAGETVTTEPPTQNQGLSVLESLAIGVCVLMLIFVYAAGIIFYVHYKQRQKSKETDVELNVSNTLTTDNASTLDSRMDMGSMRLKTNPLLKIENCNDFMHDGALSDVSEHTEDTLDSSPNNTQKKTNSNTVSAMVHSRRKKASRPQPRATSTPERVIMERLQRRSASPDMFERAPHSDMSIVDCSVENSVDLRPSPPPDGEPNIRKKLYFNPVFFEVEHLKNPPPAATDFLIKIREVMSIAKEKMTSKRFIPNLSDIPEEELYHTIDLGWDIPCARRGRRFSAISLKRENSRRAVLCGGCPGCDVKEQKNIALARSNSCKTCVSEDYRQKIVQKWLDDVPTIPPVVRPIKSVAKVSGTPRVIKHKTQENEYSNNEEPLRSEEVKTIKISECILKENSNNSRNSNSSQESISNHLTEKVINKINVGNAESCSLKHATRRVRRKLPPPPPPPVKSVESPDEVEPIPDDEVKKKMEAVIRELNQCRKSDIVNIVNELRPIEKLTPTPKTIIPIVAPVSFYHRNDNLQSGVRRKEFLLHQDQYLDSLERNSSRKRRFSVACPPEVTNNKNKLYISSKLDSKKRLSSSFKDVTQVTEGFQLFQSNSFQNVGKQSLSINEIFVNSCEPLYNNLPKPGSLTIEVRGSPIESRRNIFEDFDPDTLDRKPKREAKKRVDKILLKSGGSFKFKTSTNNDFEEQQSLEATFSRKIGSLRQIYEAKSQVQNITSSIFSERRGSVPCTTEDMTNFVRFVKQPDLIRQLEPKPPVPTKQKQDSDLILSFSDSKDNCQKFEDRVSVNGRDNLNARRSERRSARTRSRRTDLRKLYRTEDSGYLSTDSNDSKRKARYLMQLRPKNEEEFYLQTTSLPTIQIESDTDELESLCDGRSESGGESVETDSVFFGNYADSKRLFAELGLGNYDVSNKVGGIKKSLQEQIDSGFLGETSVILSGDSDSEHRSVISIIAGRDGRASASSITHLDDGHFVSSTDADYINVCT